MWLPQSTRRPSTLWISLLGIRKSCQPVLPSRSRERPCHCLKISGLHCSWTMGLFTLHLDHIKGLAIIMAGCLHTTPPHCSKRQPSASRPFLLFLEGGFGKAEAGRRRIRITTFLFLQAMGRSTCLEVDWTTATVSCGSARRALWQLSTILRLATRPLSDLRIFEPVR